MLRKLKWYLVAYCLFDFLIGGYCGGFLPLSPAAAAQFTTVTGTVLDPNNVPYALGTITAVLILPGGQSPTLGGLPYTPPTTPTGLDKNGSFTLQLADNTQLSPGGTQWKFTVCSAGGTVQPAGGTGPQCFVSGAITISGSSQSITTQLHAAALALISAGGGNPGLSTLGPSFNVAVNYGCKPDGASGSPTDNSTCITSAFLASNAVTGGVPTVYFPCVPGTGCQYNINAGSGLSPFNPVIPTAIKCDPEVTLNFTSGSTAHAMDIGPTNVTTIPQAIALANKGYSVLYCRFTGGANLTEGIFINPFTPKVEIRGNTFFDFGNASSYSIWCQSECWWLNVQTNYEWNDDSVAHNFLMTNNATASIDDESYIANNLNVCVNSSVVVNCGVGYNLDGFFTVYSNDLAGHVPAVRVKAHTNGGHIFENVIEIDVPAAGNKAAIESNNGGSDTQVEVAGNNLYTGAATDSLVGVTGGSDVVTLWNVHDNWIRLDSVAQGLVFSLNNLANQTSKIVARNNARFGGLINAGSNLGQIYSDQEIGNSYFTVGAGGLTLIPNANNPGVLSFYNQYAVTSAWATGLNNPGVGSVTTNFHLAYFNGSTWNDKYLFFNQGGMADEGTTFGVSGCGATTATGGASTGTYKSVTAGSCTATITPGGTAPNGWICDAHDITTTADANNVTLGTSTTTTVNMVEGTVAANDIIAFKCTAF